jgi:hypothetical protein
LKDLHKYIDPENIQEEFGGNSKYKYNSENYE